MSIARSAEVTWEGSSARGGGTFTAASSSAFTGLPFREITRVADTEGETSSEELLAAAHGGCFAMSLASELTAAKTPPGKLRVRCTIVLDNVEGQGWRIVRSELEVRGSVPGSDRAAFEQAVALADKCPFSELIRAGSGIVDITTVWEEAA